MIAIQRPASRSFRQAGGSGAGCTMALDDADRRPSADEVDLEAPGALALRHLAARSPGYAPHDGAFPLRLPAPTPCACQHHDASRCTPRSAASLCLVAQGAKTMMLGSEVFEYDPAQCSSLPSICPSPGQVTRASQREPYLGFKLDLDARAHR